MAPRTDSGAPLVGALLEERLLMGPACQATAAQSSGQPAGHLQVAIVQFPHLELGEGGLP